eukprot:10637000-Heterocapsa_arctica.AAC.1
MYISVYIALSEKNPNSTFLVGYLAVVARFGPTFSSGPRSKATDADEQGLVTQRKHVPAARGRVWSRPTPKKMTTKQSANKVDGIVYGVARVLHGFCGVSAGILRNLLNFERMLMALF